MKTLGVLLCVLSLSLCAQATMTMVDDYSDYDAVAAGIYDTGSGWRIPGPAAGVTFTETGLNSTLGGNRTILYNATSSTGTSLVMAPAGPISAVNNGFDFSTAVFSYSNFNIDLTTGSKIVLDIDPDHFTFQKNAVISVTVGDGITTDTVTKNSWGHLPYNPDRFDLEFAVADFAGVDLTAVSEISLSIETDVSGDYALYGFWTDAVPEPATVALLSLGGILLRRRK